VTTRRTALLAAASEELVERDGTLEVASVAASAGVSVGLIYRHFGSKAGLVTAVVDDFYARLDEAALGIDPVPGAGWAERERVRLELGVGFHYEDPLAPVLLAKLARDPEVAAAEARHLARQVAEGTRNVKAGQRSGEIPADLDPGIAAALMLGGMRQALVEVLTRRRVPPQGARRRSALAARRRRRRLQGGPRMTEAPHVPLRAPRRDRAHHHRPPRGAQLHRAAHAPRAQGRVAALPRRGRRRGRGPDRRGGPGVLRRRRPVGRPARRGHARRRRRRPRAEPLDARAQADDRGDQRCGVRGRPGVGVLDAHGGRRRARDRSA
jgi:AcrR family transcriptional regulator